MKTTPLTLSRAPSAHDRAPMTTGRASRLVLAGGVIALSLAFAGCASTPKPNPDLDAARQQVQMVESNPSALSYAPNELRDAKDALRRADTAWNDGDKEETAHLSELASRRAKVAMAIAQSRADGEQLKNVQAETDRIRLQARQTEAERARAQASDAQMQAQQAQMQAQQAQAQAERLRNELSSLQAQQSDRGMVVTFGDVLFAFNSSTLAPSATPKLDKLVEFLNENPQRKISVEGYTDSVGSENYNQQLSLRRAEAIKQALVLKGISPDRVMTQGLGESYPVADNGTADGRAMNRRVEVVIGDEQGGVKSRSAAAPARQAMGQ
ncbi:OmpA family protein [Derxia gummosa]|uniref:OmpA family protein n=1 Tax=Derxia gummosa DSM 723 TaxID=1121388 RepID=A0A9U5GXC7_9BURK|nr:OmpA family protein [Derxia gummosa]